MSTTAPQQAARPKAPGADEDLLATAVMVELHRLVKQATLYTSENEAQRQQLLSVQQAIHDFGRRTGANPRIYFADKSVYIGRRLFRAGRQVYESALEVAEILKRFDIDEVALGYDISVDELRQFQTTLGLALRNAGPAPNTFRYARLRLRKGRPLKARRMNEDLSPQEVLVRSYCLAVVAVRRFLEALQLGKLDTVVAIQRVAEQLVDVTHEMTSKQSPAFLAGVVLYNVRGESAGRAVNAAMLALAMTRQLSDQLSTLSRVAMASLLYDVGLPRVTGAGPDGEGRVGSMLPRVGIEQERELPAATAAVVTAINGCSDAGMMHAALTYEALSLNLRANARNAYGGVHAPSIEARIVATSRRFTELLADPEEERTAEQAMMALMREGREEADKTTARLLMAALGMYPTGTTVELSNGTIARVIQTPNDPKRFGFPVVQPVLDASGGRLEHVDPIDLEQASHGGLYVTRVMALGDGSDGADQGRFGSQRPSSSARATTRVPGAASTVPPASSAPHPSSIAPTVAPQMPEAPATAEAADDGMHHDAERRARTMQSVEGPTSPQPIPIGRVGLTPAPRQRPTQESPGVEPPPPNPNPFRQSSEERFGEAIAGAVPDSDALSVNLPDTDGQLDAFGAGLNAIVDDRDARARERAFGGAATHARSKSIAPILDDAIAVDLGTALDAALSGDGSAFPYQDDEQPVESVSALGLRDDLVLTPLDAEAERRIAERAMPVTAWFDERAAGLSPSAEGTLAKTPLTHLFVYLLDQSLTGTVILSAADGATACAFYCERGTPLNVRTPNHVALLDSVLESLGLADHDTLARAVATIKRTGELLGEHLVRNDIVDSDSLELALKIQATRKLEYLLDLPDDTNYYFFESHDLLAGYGGLDRAATDPLALIATGVRRRRRDPRIDHTLARLGRLKLTIHPDANIGRLALDSDESAVVTQLLSISSTLHELAHARVASVEVLKCTVYVLAITRSLYLGAQARGPVGSSYVPVPSSKPKATTEAAVVEDSAAAPVASVPEPPTSPSPGQETPPAADDEPESGTVVMDSEDLISAPVSDSGAVVPRRAPPPPPAIPPARPPVASVPPQRASVAPPLPPPPRPSSPVAGSPIIPAPSPPLRPRPPVATSRVTPPRMPTPGTSPAAGPPSNRRGAASAAEEAQAPSPARPSTPVAAPPRPSAPAAAPPRPSTPVAARPDATAPAPAPAPAAGPRKGPTREEVLKRASEIDQQNYFEILGVAPDTPTPAVQSAYFQLAKSWHPDRAPADLEDLKPESGRIFARISEAFQTLQDPTKRAAYVESMKSGGGTNAERELLEKAVDSAMLFQKAEVLFKRGSLAQAEVLIQRCVDADPQPDYQALLAWIQALRLGDPPTLAPGQKVDTYQAQIRLLDAALSESPTFEKALFYRAELYKRSGMTDQALRDFKKVVQLNPRNIDAAREVRIHDMRSGRLSQPQQGGGLFGKLFKKE